MRYIDGIVKRIEVMILGMDVYEEEKQIERAINTQNDLNSKCVRA